MLHRTRVLEEHGSPPQDFSLYWSLPPNITLLISYPNWATEHKCKLMLAKSPDSAHTKTAPAGGGWGRAPRRKFWPPTRIHKVILQKTTATMVFYTLPFTSCRTHNSRERLCNDSLQLSQQTIRLRSYTHLAPQRMFISSHSHNHEYRQPLSYIQNHWTCRQIKINWLPLIQQSPKPSSVRLL